MPKEPTPPAVETKPVAAPPQDRAVKPAMVKVRVRDQPVDGPRGVHRAGDVFETTAAHAQRLGKLVQPFN